MYNVGIIQSSHYDNKPGIRICNNVKARVITELRRPKAAMRNPIPIEPMHSFSYGHHWSRARTYVRTTTTKTPHNMAPMLVNLCNAAYNLQLTVCMPFGIGDPFHSQMTAVKIRHPLTCITWPYRGLKCRTHRGLVFFFKVDHWPGYGLSLDRGLNYLHKLLQQANNSKLRF